MFVHVLLKKAFNTELMKVLKEQQEFAERVDMDLVLIQVGHLQKECNERRCVICSNNYNYCSFCGDEYISRNFVCVNEHFQVVAPPEEEEEEKEEIRFTPTDKSTITIEKDRNFGSLLDENEIFIIDESQKDRFECNKWANAFKSASENKKDYVHCIDAFNSMKRLTVIIKMLNLKVKD